MSSIATRESSETGRQPRHEHADPAISTALARNFSQFRTAVNASFVPLQVSCDRPDPFAGRIRTSGADDVHVSEIRADRHVVERTPDLIARAERHYFKLSMQLSGTGLLIQDNREALMQPGDIAIYDTRRPYTLAFDEGMRSLVVMFPQSMIDLPADVVGQLTAVTMTGRQGLGSMIAPFLAQLSTNLEQLAASTGARLAHTTLDLVTTMLASELDLQPASAGTHEALMRQIRTFIDEHLAVPDLGPAQIAAAHFISTRHLHAVFREQGTTVSSWIRTRRLERCRRDLVDPVHADKPVGQIASRWGFVDAAHFSRVFKAAYGQSPSDLRASRAA